MCVQCIVVSEIVIGVCTVYSEIVIGVCTVHSEIVIGVCTVYNGERDCYWCVYSVQ